MGVRIDSERHYTHALLHALLGEYSVENNAFKISQVKISSPRKFNPRKFCLAQNKTAIRYYQGDVKHCAASVSDAAIRGLVNALHQCTCTDR